MAIELSYEELDAYIQQIVFGTKIIHVKNKYEVEVPLLFRYPTGRAARTAELVHTNALKKAEAGGLPSVADMEAEIGRRGIYTDEDDEKIEKLKSRIEGQRSVLAKTTRVPARRDRLKENIYNLQEEIEKIRLKKESTLELTRERKASEEKFLYLTSCGVFDPFTECRYWETDEAFDNEPDFLFRKRVFIEYIVFAHGLQQDIVRYIARSNVWRIRYITALKVGADIFGIPVRDYNVDQLTLMYWSHFYQSIYEMLSNERPPDTIIEDDEALDAYMKDWHAERNRDAVAARSKNKSKYGKDSAWDYNETLVMESNPMHKDIEYSDTIAEKVQGKGVNTLDAAPLGKVAKRNNPLKLDNQGRA